MEMRITNEPSPRWFGAIVERMREPRLGIDSTRDYPDFNAWADKVYRQLNSGDKRAMVAIERRKVAGVVVYQQDTHNPLVLKVRNITIADSGRMIGSFLLRNVAVAAMRELRDVRHIMTDTKVNNKEMIAFLLANGFYVRGVEDLYGKGAGLDVVMQMDVQKLSRLR